MAKKTTKKTVKKRKKASAKKTSAHASARQKAVKSKLWSQDVTEHSDAMTLDDGVLTKGTPRAIALSLKHSAERSHRRKSEPYRSAMSMLTFFINRAGRGLSAARKAKLEKAKAELRKLYDKD